MSGGKGKRAVIINNINSGTIEQAIFILKSPACEQNVSPGSVIVAEAQEIINSYISRIEGGQYSRKNSKRIKISGIIAIALGAILVLMTTGLLFLR